MNLREITTGSAWTVLWRNDVWYATNGEIYDYVNAYENLVFSADGKRIYNPSKMPVWVEIDGTCYKIEDEFVME